MPLLGLRNFFDMYALSVESIGKEEYMMFVYWLQVSPCMERAVLDQLVDHFEFRLARYPTTLEEDEAMVMSNKKFCVGNIQSLVC